MPPAPPHPPADEPAAPPPGGGLGAAARPRPVRTTLSLLTPLWWVLGAALLAVLLLGWAARWVLFTDAGTAWLLNHLPMVTEARGVQGALLGPRWRAERLRVQWDGGRQWLVLDGLAGDDLAWHWWPGGEDAGLWLALRVGNLQVRRLQVKTGPPGPRPLPLPASLAPPLRLDVVRASVGKLHLDGREPVSDLAAEELRFDGRAGARHGVAQLTGRAQGVHVRAAASLGNTHPYPLAAEATVVPALTVEADAPPWAAVLRAAGPLAAFELSAVLLGRPAAAARRPGRAGPAGRAGGTPAVPALDLQAVVRPLEAWPVQRLTGRTEALDLAALHGAAPQTLLEGEVEVQAAASTAPVAVRLNLRNHAPGRWNERRVPVGRLELEARGELARPDRIELSRFELNLADATTEVAGSAGRIDGRATWAGTQLELQARLHDVRPQRLDSRAPAMTLGGPLQLTLSGLPALGPARGTAPGTAPTTSAAGRATPPALRVAGQLELEGRVDGAPRAVTVRAEGQGSAETVELRHLQVRSGDAQAVLRLALSRGASREWTLASEGSLAELDPAPWWPGEVGSAWRQGPHRLNAGWQFELRAPAEAPQLLQTQPVALLQRLAGNGHLRLHDSVLAGVPLQGEATLGYRPALPGAAPGRLRADLQLGGNRIVVEGEGDPAGSGNGDRWRAELRAGTLSTLAPLARLSPAMSGWVPRRGNVQAELTADGRWPRMATQGQVRVEDLQAGELALASAQARWRIDLTELAAARAPLTLDAQASGIALGGRRAEDLRAELSGTLAEHRLALRTLLPVAPGAGTEKVLNISGGSGTRAQLLASGQWQPQPGGGGRWLARVDELDLGPAQLAGPTATAPATVPATAAATATAPATSPPAPAASAAPASAPAAAAGASPPAAASGGAGEGVRQAASPAAASSAPPSARWFEARNLRAQLVFDADGQLQTMSAEPGRVRLAESFALRWDAVQVDMRSGRADFALSADIEPFSLPPLLRRLQPQIGWQGDLRMAARVDVRAGERFEADVVLRRHDGDLHVLTQGELQLLGLTEFRLQVKARDGLWEFEPVFAGRGLGEIRGRLRARTTPERRWPADDAPIEGQVRARVPDIGVWGHWVPPGWRLVGELTTTAEVGGRFGAPSYTGELAGRGLGVRNLLQGVNVSDGRLLVKLAGTQARIETFTLKGGDGTASVTGQAELADKPSARLKLEADRFRVLGRVDRMLTASGQAELALAADTARLDGKFRIDEGLFDFTRADAPSLDEDVTVRGAEAAIEMQRPAAEPQGRQRFAMAVDVDLGKNLRAKGRGVDTGLTGAVRITNPGGRLQVHGTIESVEGTYAAYGQKLELEKGVLAFSGPPDNPWLDIWALRPNLDIRVGLQVSGPLQGLRVRLFSDPEMSETDKLSWLVLGRPSDGLGRNDTALLQRAAVALLAGEGEAPTDAFMRRLGIDELSLRQSEGEVRETVVSLGKQLSRRWYVGYERGVNATTGTWQLIYRVAQRFTLRAQSGLENSLDFIWTVRLQQPPDDRGVRRSLPAVPP